MHKIEGFRIWLLILFFLLSSIGLYAVQNQSNYILHGKAIDQETRSGAIYVNVFNESQRTGCLSDLNGNFSLEVAQGDTLVFYSMVYLGKLFYIADSALTQNIELVLTPKKFEIEEAKVFGFRSYHDFKKAFVALELEESPTDVLKEKIADWTLEGVKLGIYDKQIDDIRYWGGGFGIRTSMGSGKNLKMRDVIDQMEERNRRMEIIDMKFNREIVAKLTKLPDEEIDDFILFCKFNDEFLYRSLVSEIEIRILEKLDQFKKKKDSGFLMKEEWDNTALS